MRIHIILPLALVFADAVPGQFLDPRASGPANLLPSDAAVLEDRKLRTDLPCMVKPVNVEIGFDLSFHAGYEVSVPLHELGGEGNRLTAIFRVSQAGKPENAVFFSQKWTVPPLKEEAKGTAVLRGSFLLGEGKYQIEWLMRDEAERYCTARWRVQAGAHGKDKAVELRLPPGTVEPEPAEPFATDAPVKRSGEHPLNVLVLLHAAPRAPGGAAMLSAETSAVSGILQNIAHEPRIGKYTVVAFNLDRNEVYYRRDNVSQIDFPALGEAIRQLQLATIDIRKLRETAESGPFLGELLARELEANVPDAVIFVGPKTSGGSAARRGWDKSLVQPQCPIFYLNYDPDPFASPWHDMIGSAVKLWHGFEFTISRPRDIFTAWTQVMFKISSTKSQPVVSRPEAITGLMGK